MNKLKYQNHKSKNKTLDGMLNLQLKMLIIIKIWNNKNISIINARHIQKTSLVHFIFTAFLIFVTPKIHQILRNFVSIHVYFQNQENFTNKNVWQTLLNYSFKMEPNTVFPIQFCFWLVSTKYYRMQKQIHYVYGGSKFTNTVNMPTCIQKWI